ncbi:YeeE/YedE family protein [Flavobacterium agricola]|uniref:YeeE/YedE family protein n=1 Tax=Flavobacterium agricola TaxID=2870839 RepID=A0ABY6M0S6_9FLAO|nr:YeeE/YedE family protein [Flavobacterium agricola]UYW00808.1 YeeE/YedE family protein [Flavobacterium agricola]
MKNFIYILLGMAFGIVMYKAETASWFRIYEMFQFQSFHMYGFMGGALFVGVLGTYWIKKSDKKDFNGNPIIIQPKEKSIARYLIGGISFGLGWALIGACPGPMFVLVGAGVWSMLIVIFGALVGTYLYGLIKHKLPH